MYIIGYIKVNGKYTPVKSYSWNEFKNRKMDESKIKKGDRLYHCCFGWCTVTHPINADMKTLVNLECDELEYYKIGYGLVRSERPQKGAEHILYTPISDLYKNPDHIDSIGKLKEAALNPTLTMWEK